MQGWHKPNAYTTNPYALILWLQALLLLPSCLISSSASVVAWQTLTNTCWWQTTWTGVTAGCCRSFPASSAALWSEVKCPAPRTAARARLRHGMTRWGSSPRQRGLRRESAQNLKCWKPTARPHLLLHQGERHSNHLEPSKPTQRSSHKIPKKKKPSAKDFVLRVKGTKLQTLSTSGGPGRDDCLS